MEEISQAQERNSLGAQGRTRPCNGGGNDTTKGEDKWLNAGGKSTERVVANLAEGEGTKSIG